MKALIWLVGSAVDAIDIVIDRVIYRFMPPRREPKGWEHQSRGRRFWCRVAYLIDTIRYWLISLIWWLEDRSES